MAVPPFADLQWPPRRRTRYVTGRMLAAGARPARHPQRVKGIRARSFAWDDPHQGDDVVI
jgi:hypothetical protein